MAVTHSTAARNAATDAVTALIGASGRLKFLITGSTVGALSTVVANLALSATGFGASSTGTATANAITSDTSATGGTIAFAALTTSAGTAVIHCAVATTGSDINVTAGGLAVTAGDTVACSALTYTALSA